MKVNISIIIPVYNVAQYLEQCLDSVFSQMTQQYEVLCINDGSTDHSAQILNKFQRSYSQLRIIHQENKGLGETRNIGIKNSNGEFILFLDSDDYLEPNTLEELYKTAVTKKIDILDFKTYSVRGENKTEWRGNYLLIDSPISGKEYFNKYVQKYSKQPFVSAWSHLFRREFIINNNLRFIKNRLYEDLPFTAEAYLLAENVYFLNEFIYNYRFNDTSITKKKISKNNIIDLIYISDVIYKISNKYCIVIPLDNFFSSTLKNTMLLTRSGRFKDISTIIKNNPFILSKKNLFKYKNRLYYSLLKVKLIYSLFYIYLYITNIISARYY